LSRDHPYSLAAIAGNLRDSANQEHDLEVALVVAARALGFVATHIGGDCEPDGIAEFRSYPDEELKMTLEAKSSAMTPELSNIDFAGLWEHMDRNKASGCLLAAPSYPGMSRGADSAVSY